MESAKDVGKNVEVNECQKALDKLKTHCLSSPSLQNGEENGFGPDYDMHHDCYEDETQLLQELVDKVSYYKELEDKAIPMKPLNTRINHNGLKVGGCECLYHIDNHRSTNTEVDETYNFCKKCGKALDWSNDE